MKHPILLVTLIGLVICLCGCSAQNEISIGVNLELSGRLAQYGSNCYEGISLAAKQINASGGIRGKKVRLEVYDNCSQNAQSALAVQRLAYNEKVCAILGPSTSQGVKASLACDVDIPIITPSATADNLTPDSAKKNIFRTCYTDTRQGQALAKFVYSFGYRKIALLTDNSSDYSVGISNTFSKSFTAKGGQITQQKFYSSNETDFCGVLSSFKLQDIDAFFIPGYYTEAGMIIRQARGLGITKPIFSGDAFDSPALEELAGGTHNLENVFFSNHYAPENGSGNFLKKYELEYQKKPAAYCALGYDSAMLLFDAIERAGSTSPQELTKALYSTQNFNGATGKITIDEQGNAEKQVLLIGFENGQRTLKATETGR